MTGFSEGGETEAFVSLDSQNLETIIALAVEVNTDQVLAENLKTTDSNTVWTLKITTDTSNSVEQTEGEIFTALMEDGFIVSDLTFVSSSLANNQDSVSGVSQLVPPGIILLAALMALCIYRM